jgi:WD40 repeat protein/DNA-binding SARP family transcriptional activator
LQPLATRREPVAAKGPSAVLPGSTLSAVRFALLGATEVDDGRDGRPLPIGGAVQRRVLTVLLAHRGHVVTVDQLVLGAWGDDPPPTAARTLQSHVTRLRGMLAQDGGVAGISFAGGGYRLDVDPDALDTTRFSAGIQTARATAGDDPDRAADELARTLTLWRGRPYADLVDTDYPAAEAAALEELRLAVQVDHAAYVLQAGHAAAAVAELEALVAAQPFLEPAWELLVTALYRQGRQADALAAYQRARTALDEELGVEPGPALRAVEQRVLTQDEALLGRAPVRPMAQIPCPYKGLTRYEVADSALFFGRERQVEELVASLVDRRLLVVVGPSGAGKSSVLRAGLLPRLAAGAVPGSQDWAAGVVVPASGWLATVDAQPDLDLLVVDQAEGAFGDDVPPGERRAVADRLVSVLPRTRVVLAIRADLYGRLAEHPDLARLVGPATVLLGPPSVDDLRRIVTEPARTVGLTVEPALVDRVVTETYGRPAALPLLSTALVRLWEQRDGDRLTLAAYLASGGVAGALERAGEDAFAALADDGQRAAARRMLVRLARLEDGRWVGRRAPVAEVAPPGDPAAQAAADALRDHRLVVSLADTYEVAHEALFTGWPRLAGWLADAASSRHELERLAGAAADWSAEGQDEGQLLRGARLVAATDLVQAHPGDVATAERAYVEASAAAAERAADAERARTWAALRSRRRTRILAGALAVALVASVSAGTVAVRQARQASAAAVAADAGRLGALARAGTLAQDQALLLGAQAQAMHPGPTADSDLLAALSRSPALAAAARAPSRILGLSVTPDGRQVLTAGVEGQIATWRSDDLQPVSTFSGPSGAYVAATPDGTKVLGWQGQGSPPSVEVRDAGGRTTFVADVPSSDVSPQVALTGTSFAYVAAADDHGETVEVRRVLDPRQPVAAAHVPGHVVTVLACGPARFCVMTDDGVVRLLSVTSGVLGPAVAMAGTQAQPGPAVASDDGSVLALSSGAAGLLEIRALPSGRLLHALQTPPYDGRPLAFSPDGSLLATYDDGLVVVWDVASGAVVRAYAGHIGAVIAGAWSPDGRTLYTGGLDRQLLAWDIAGDHSLVRMVPLGENVEVSTVWATPDAVVLGTADGRMLFVHRPDGTITRPSQRAGSDWVNTARSGGRSALLVVADIDGTVTIWDSATGTFRGTVDLPKAEVEPQVWVSDDGVTAATLRSSDGPLYLIDLPTGTVRTVPLHVPDGIALEMVYRWTPDGHVVVAASSKGPNAPIDQVLIVDPRSGAVDRRVPVDGRPGEVAVDPTGTWLAAAGQDGFLRFVSLADGHLLAPPQLAVDGQVYNVNVSPDGRYVVTAGAPGQVRLWDTQTFRQVGPDLPSPVGSQTARVRFTPDGSVAAVFSPYFEGQPRAEKPQIADGGDVSHGPVLWIYPVGSAAWRDQACRVAGRTLTQAEWDTYLAGQEYDPACR